MVPELDLDGFTWVPAGKIVAVVTHLEMRAANGWRRDRPDGVGLEAVAAPDPGWYRKLFRRIGDDWLWFSRLALGEAELGRVLADPARSIHAVRQGDRDIGMLELDFTVPGEAEIAFFGLVPDAVGRGIGPWLMGEALAMCWSRDGVERVWLHTCTLDHPRALGFYAGCGFVAVGRQIEIRDDPRLSGLLAMDAAPHHPVIRPE